MRFACLLAAIGFMMLLPACRPDPCPQPGMAFVPPGGFLMGQNDGRSSNQPQHQVYLDGYCIQRTEVTRRAFASYLSKTGQRYEGLDPQELSHQPDLPVTGVLWQIADSYCRWAGLRLPTEAEWEKAARGSDGRRYPWGDEWNASRANTVENGRGSVTPVGSFPAGASPYGLLDMSGNAAEWVADYFTLDYYQVSPDHNPPGPDQVLDHGLRGGSYAAPAEQATTYFRDSSHSAQPNPRAGFRCAAYTPP